MIQVDFELAVRCSKKKMENKLDLITLYFEIDTL